MPRLFARLQDEQRRAFDSVVAMPLHDDAVEFGPERREYRLRVESITAEAADDDGIVKVSIRSLTTWRFAIAGHTTQRLTEPEFLDVLTVAISRVLRAYRAERFRIKDQVYGFGYPPELRRQLGMDIDQGAWR
jgi:hypothetical protein